MTEPSFKAGSLLVEMAVLFQVDFFLVILPDQITTAFIPE